MLGMGRRTLVQLLQEYKSGYSSPRLSHVHQMLRGRGLFRKRPLRGKAFLTESLT